MSATRYLATPDHVRELLVQRLQSAPTSSSKRVNRWSVTGSRSSPLATASSAARDSALRQYFGLPMKNRSKPSSAFAIVQPSFSSPTTLPHGDAHIVEEYFAELLVTGDVP